MPVTVTDGTKVLWECSVFLKRLSYPSDKPFPELINGIASSFKNGKHTELVHDMDLPILFDLKEHELYQYAPDMFDQIEHNLADIKQKEVNKQWCTNIMYYHTAMDNEIVCWTIIYEV